MRKARLRERSSRVTVNRYAICPETHQFFAVNSRSTMVKWTVPLFWCLHLISASFDYVYDEHSLMGKKLVLYALQ